MMGPWISCLLGSLESFCLALPSSHQFTNLSLVLEETTISVLESQDRWALNNFQERFTMSWYGCMPFPFLLTSHKWWSGFGTMWWESVDWSQKQRDKPKDFEAHTSSFQIITPCHGDWHRGDLPCYFLLPKKTSPRGIAEATVRRRRASWSSSSPSASSARWSVSSGDELN